LNVVFKVSEEYQKPDDDKYRPAKSSGKHTKSC